MTGKKFQPQPDQLLPKLALYSQSYQQEILLKRVTTLLERPIVSRQGLREALTNPISSARVFFGYYAFARAGGERAGYSEVCVRLLKGDRATLTQAVSSRLSREIAKSGRSGQTGN